MKIKSLYASNWCPFPELLGVPKDFVNNYPVVNQEILIGIEIEAENFPGVFALPMEDQVAISEMWTSKAEGSLRNNGIEFVSPPIKGETIGYALTLLEKMNEAANLDYTDLAGLHIHVNVREFSVEQLAVLSLLYVVFEDSLYRISGHRSSSIYCVPARICKSGLNSLIVYQDLRMAFSESRKYMGFNYKTIRTFGTIEYRHASGTRDVTLILKWINILLRLHEAAVAYPLEEIKLKVFELNTNSAYSLFSEEIFKDYAHLLDHPDLSKEMGNGVSVLKEWCIDSSVLSDRIKDRVVRSKEKVKKLAAAEKPNVVIFYDEVN